MEVGNVVHLPIFTMRLEARALWVVKRFCFRQETKGHMLWKKLYKDVNRAL